MKSALIVAILVSSCSFGQVVDPPKVEFPSIEVPKHSHWRDYDYYVDATFPGGAIALKHYLREYDVNKTLNWSDSSFNARGYYHFVVEVDGTTNQIEVLRSISPEADSLAIELISNMPKWRPAEDKNGPVRCRVRLPIVFSKKE